MGPFKWGLVVSALLVLAVAFWLFTQADPAAGAQVPQAESAQQQPPSPPSAPLLGVPEGGCLLEGTVTGEDGGRLSPIVVTMDGLPPGAPHQYLVRTRDSAFIPSVLGVARGDSVEFRNEDVRPHELYADREVNLFRSKETSREVMYERLFIDRGVTFVGCRIHSAESMLILSGDVLIPVDPSGHWRVDLQRPGLHVLRFGAQGMQTSRAVDAGCGARLDVALHSVRPPKATSDPWLSE